MDDYHTILVCSSFMVYRVVPQKVQQVPRDKYGSVPLIFRSENKRNH